MFKTGRPTVYELTVMAEAATRGALQGYFEGAAFKKLPQAAIDRAEELLLEAIEKLDPHEPR